MLNPLHEVEVIGEDIVKGVEYPFKHIGQAIVVIDEVIKDEPAVKQAVITLIEKCDAIGAEVMQDVAEKGINLPDDLKTAQDIAALGTYLKSTFFPLIAQVYATIKTDIKATQAS